MTGSRLQLRARERAIVSAALAAAAALAVLIVVALSVGGRTSGHGCVDVSIPSATGGQQLDRCGAAARRLCSSAGTPGGFTGAAGNAVKTECRKAGLTQ